MASEQEHSQEGDTSDFSSYMTASLDNSQHEVSEESFNSEDGFGVWPLYQPLNTSKAKSLCLENDHLEHWSSDAHRPRVVMRACNASEDHIHDPMKLPINPQVTHKANPKPFPRYHAHAHAALQPVANSEVESKAELETSYDVPDPGEKHPDPVHDCIATGPESAKPRNAAVDSEIPGFDLAVVAVAEEADGFDYQAGLLRKLSNLDCESPGDVQLQQDRCVVWLRSVVSWFVVILAVGAVLVHVLFK